MSKFGTIPHTDTMRCGMVIHRGRFIIPPMFILRPMAGVLMAQEHLIPTGHTNTISIMQMEQADLATQADGLILCGIQNPHPDWNRF